MQLFARIVCSVTYIASMLALATAPAPELIWKVIICLLGSIVYSYSMSLTTLIK